MITTKIDSYSIKSNPSEGVWLPLFVAIIYTKKYSMDTHQH